MNHSSQPKKYFGKYRGTVIQNIDLEFRGRIQCIVPDVLGLVPSTLVRGVRPAGGPDRSADGGLHGAADRRGRVGGVRTRGSE